MPSYKSPSQRRIEAEKRLQQPNERAASATPDQLRPPPSEFYTPEATIVNIRLEYDDESETTESETVQNSIQIQNTVAATEATETIETNSIKMSAITNFMSAIGPFNYNGGDIETLGTRWEVWLKAYEYLETAIAEDDAGKRRAHLLLMMGADARDVYEASKDTDDTKNSVDTIKKLMSTRFASKRSEFSQSCLFRRTMRNQGETMDDFAMRLTKMAKLCGFESSQVAKNVKEQFVCGCGRDDVYTKCCREAPASLEAALAIARGYETTTADLNALHAANAGKNVNFVGNSNSNSNLRHAQASNGKNVPSGPALCRNCARPAHSEPQQCPARGKTCNNCGRLNHFNAACMSSTRVRDSRDISNIGNNHTGHNNNRRFGGGDAQQRSRTNQQQHQRQPHDWRSSNGKQVGQIAHGSGQTDYTGSCMRGYNQNADRDYQEYLQLKSEAAGYEFASVNKGVRFQPPNRFRAVVGQYNQQRSNDGVRATVSVMGSKLSMLIDTGAPINIIDEATYGKLERKPSLYPCRSPFYGFGSSDPLPIIGQFTTDVSFKAQSVRAGFLVLSGSEICLLSRRTAEALGLVRFAEEINDDSQTIASASTSIDSTMNQLQMSSEQLKRAFPNLFSGQLGCIKGVTVKLDVDPEARPVKQGQRPVAIHLRDTVAEEIKRQVADGILEPVDSTSGPTPWIANLVVVPKAIQSDSSDGAPSRPEVRLTCDSRDLNKAIRRIRYPGKTVEDIIYMVNGARVFSKLDITKAFHQLAIDESSRNLTTITTHIGLFRYRRLHMGISCASEIFTETVRKILEGCPGQLNMTDDVLVYGKTAKEHQENLLRVLKQLEDSGITLNLAKCKFYQPELTFFGLQISAEGVATTAERCRALREASPPTNAKDLRSFLGSVGFCSRFMGELNVDLSTVAEPLWRLTKNDAPWRWTEEEENAFERVKDLLSSRRMAFFDRNWHTELVVDASPVGLGAVLTQVDPSNPERKRIICFASRLLTAVERRYSQCEKEALAAVWGCERYWLYLFGAPFTLVTDNRAVQYILSHTAARPPARIERWALRLTQFDYIIKHRPGATNIADYFSRHPDCKVSLKALVQQQETERYVNLVTASLIPRAVTMQEMARASLEDPEIAEMTKYLRSADSKSKSDALPTSLVAFKTIIDELSVQASGILIRGQRIVVPVSLRNRIVQLAHRGHQGIVKTKALIRSRVWFPGIDAHVERTVKNCVECQANTDRQQYAPLKPSEMPAGPWQEISGDFLGPLPDGTYWFVNHCDYSRWISVEVLHSLTADVVTRALTKLFAVLGTPFVYKTDNGPPFFSNQFAQFAADLGFTHRKVTPLWPRANGEVESVMKKLNKVARAASVAGENRLAALVEFLRVYRETPHTTTKVAPAVLLLGYSRTSGIPQIELSNKDVADLHSFAKANDTEAKQRMKEDYDRRMRAIEPTIFIGSKVLIKLEKVNKLTPAWDPNPFTVVAIKGSMVTAERSGSNPVTRNSSFFKLYRFDDDDGPAKQHQTSQQAETPASPEQQQQISPQIMPTPHEPVPGQVPAAQQQRQLQQEQPAPLRPPTIPASVPKGVTAPTTAKPTMAKQQPGRPTNEAAAAKKQQQAEALAEQRRLNPPARSSARVANQQAAKPDNKQK